MNTLEIVKNTPESKILDLTRKDLNVLSLEAQQHMKKFETYADLDLNDYLDEDMKKDDTTEIETFLDPNKIKEIEKGKSYKYGDIIITKSADKWKLTVKSSASTYLRNTNRIKDLASPLTLAWGNNSLEDCERFAAFINYTAYFFNGNKAGTDNIGDVELDNFGSNYLSDNNPFYVSGDNLYFYKGGATLGGTTIISQDSLDRMVKWVKIEQLAKFFTNRVKYTFDNE